MSLRFSSSRAGLAEDHGSRISPGRIPHSVVAPSGDTTGVADGKAITAALAQGQQIHFQPGHYFDNQQRVWDGLTNPAWQGAGGASNGAVPATTLTYTGTAAPYLSAHAAIGGRIADMQLVQNNAGMTGYLIDAYQSRRLLLERAQVGGASGATGTTLLNANQSLNVTIRDTPMFAGQHAIQGVGAGGSDYSNVLTIEGSQTTFTQFALAPILSPGQSWTIIGANFEALANGRAGGISDSAGAVMGLAVIGCWFGDASDATTGSWIDCAPTGAAYIANYIATGFLGVNLGPSSTGVSVLSNHFDTITTALGVGANCDRLTLIPNEYTACGTRVSYASPLPTNSIYDTGQGLTVSGLTARGGILPSTPTGGVGASNLFSGTGAPSDTNGANGDTYLRSDGGAGTTLYQKRAGAWVGVA